MLLKIKKKIHSFHIFPSLRFQCPDKIKMQPHPQPSPCSFPPKPVQVASASMVPCADVLTTNPAQTPGAGTSWIRPSLPGVRATPFCDAYSNCHLYCWEDSGTDQCGHSVSCPAIVPDVDGANTQSSTCPQRQLRSRSTTWGCPHLRMDAGGQTLMMSHLLARKPAKSRLGWTLL